MRIVLHFFIGVATILAFGLSNANASTIEFSANSLGGNQWRYDYVVTNDTLGISIDEFTVFFDENFYSNLQIISDITDWDLLAIQPDLGIPAPGFYDALALIDGIKTFGKQDGFLITFEYLATGNTASQSFNIIDRHSFDMLDTGSTRNIVEVRKVLALSTLVLLLCDGVPLLWLRRRQSNNIELNSLCEITHMRSSK